MMEVWDTNTFIGRRTASSTSNDTSATNMMSMMNSAAVQQETAAQWAETKALINSLMLAKVQAQRSVNVVLGAFSLAMAVLMVTRILNDARRIGKYVVPLRPKRYGCLAYVHPAEIFPLVLGFVVIIQQIIFVAIGGIGLHTVVVAGCSATAEVAFPAIFFLGYAHLVFGAELTIRSLRPKRFLPRGKWATVICLMIIAVLLILTWIPTAVWKAHNRCYASLVWFSSKFTIIAISIIGSLLLMFVIMACTITLQLLKSIKVETDERIAASRMVYYIILSIILYTLTLPFFIQGHLKTFDASYTTARLAEIPLYSSGIFISFAHMFFRVNAKRLAIEPVGVPREQRRRMRFMSLCGPSDLEMDISAPVYLSHDDMILREKERSGEDYLYRRQEKEQYRDEKKDQRVEVEKMPSPHFKRPSTPVPKASVEPPRSSIPPVPPIQPLSPSVASRGRSGSYSLFPSQAEEMPQLPSTVYTPPSREELIQPDTAKSFLPFRPSFLRVPSIATPTVSITDVHEASMAWLNRPRPLFASQHRRKSSTGSSATVQIGLRLSITPAAIAAANFNNLNRAIMSPAPAPRVLSSRAEIHDARTPNHDQVADSIPLTPVPSRNSFDLLSTPSLGSSPTSLMPPPLDPGRYLRDARDKVLPPTPRVPNNPALSGLRMNPVSPPRPARRPTSSEAEWPGHRGLVGIALSSGTASRLQEPGVAAGQENGGWI